MSYGLIIAIIFGFFMVLWFIGLFVYGYHVFKYGLPGDKTKLSFYLLLGSAVVALLIVSFSLSGLNWEAI